jgi:hypothetical protein
MAAGLALAACAAHKPAFASGPPVRFPLRILYARLTPVGFAGIPSEEAVVWTRIRSRLGGLCASIEPLQGFPELTDRPEIRSDPSGALAVLLDETLQRGANAALLYVVHDGRRSYLQPGDWPGRIITELRSRFGPYDDASAEGYLMQPAGGASLAHLRVSAPPRRTLRFLELHRNPEEEALLNLAKGMENAIRDAAGPAYAAQASIAD